MRSFFAAGFNWDIAIDPIVIEQVRTECGVDLGDRGCKQFEILTTDQIKTVAVLWAIVRQTAESRQVAREVFVKSLVSDTGEAALHALIEANIDFFPQAQQNTLRQMLEQSREIEAAVSMEAQAKVVNAEVADRIKRKALSKLDAKIAELLSEEDEEEGESSSPT